MIDFLLGVPGKLKTITDYLTTYMAAARMAKIDNCDTTTSSRAPAATALSTGVWTQGHADKVALIETDPCSRPPTLNGVSTTDYSTLSHTRYGEINYTCAKVEAGASFTHTGSGVLNLVVIDNITGSSVAASCTVTIDGVVAVAISLTATSSSMKSVVGVANNLGMVLDQIPFRTSLVISAGGLPVFYKVRKTS